MLDCASWMKADRDPDLSFFTEEMRICGLERSRTRDLSLFSFLLSFSFFGLSSGLDDPEKERGKMFEAEAFAPSDVALPIRGRSSTIGLLGDCVLKRPGERAVRGPFPTCRLPVPHSSAPSSSSSSRGSSSSSSGTASSSHSPVLLPRSHSSSLSLSELDLGRVCFIGRTPTGPSSSVDLSRSKRRDMAN